MSKLIAAALSGALLATLIAPALAQPPSNTGAAPAAGKLSTKSSIKDLLANPKAKDVLNKYAPAVVEFLSSPDASSVVPPELPLATIAENDQAQAGGLTPENMKLIEADLAGL